ncbi:hypothetical protein BGW42_000930 [Actinomortierella wolfii]|nr:hypothetical protein BGW42_000930 [Actinomortierella wolfii]
MSLVSPSNSSSPVHSPQSFILASPDRVVFKTIPHPLSSANKRVTLSFRRPAAASAPLPPPSPQDLYPRDDNPAASATTAVAQQCNSDTEDNTALPPRNSPSPNSAHSHSHHRRSMGGSLNPKELADITTDQSSSNPAVRMHVNTTKPASSMCHRSTTDEMTPTTLAAAGASMATPTTPIPVPPPVVRYHKNGLPIKSALKSPRPLSTASAAETPDNTRPSPSRSLSSPCSLSSPKYVHFNTQLEHVRLFLQGETPSSVASRETLIDPRQHEAATSNLTLTLPNWSPLAKVSAFQPDHLDGGAAPLRCENVQLNAEKTKLNGTILVQNIAFHKHVSVRYTVDFWQSYTDLGAEYQESVAGTALDRFKFEIPLEMDKTCIEKTFCMAIRYQVNGREFWDSNNGLNYQVECKREIVVPSVSEITRKMNTMMLGSSYLPEYHKPILRKKPSNSRYDLSSSLSATFTSRGGSGNTTNNSGMNRNKGIDIAAAPMTTAGSQSPYRASEYISAPIQSPPDFHRQLYASSPKFVSPYLGSASPPEHFRIGFEPVMPPSSPNGGKKALSTTTTGSSSPKVSWGFEIESSVPPMVTRSHTFPSSTATQTTATTTMAKSAPISIPTPATTVGRPAVGSASYYDLVDRYCFYESSPHSSPYSTYSNSPPAPCIRG